MTTSYVPTIYSTEQGTLYLKEPGASLVSAPQFFPQGATKFVNSFEDTFDAEEYENDWYVQTHSGSNDDKPKKLDAGTALAKFAGQTCYLSFGEKRSHNDKTSVDRYFENIKSSGHGSVLEHVNYSIIFWGLDRSWSHEAVRHRAGFGFSQVSQRYVSGKTLRFVERPEYQESDALHERFCVWIDQARYEYEMRGELLARQMAVDPAWEKMPATERRKAVNQAARSCLPNETETAIVITGNVRAWRNLIDQRANKHADKPIQGMAKAAYSILVEQSPTLFNDYVADETGALSTPYRKV
jgi:thymidylate synthase (FAD)